MSSYGGMRTPISLHAPERPDVDLAQERAIALETALALLAQAVLILDREKVLIAAAHADGAQQIVARELEKYSSRT